MAVVNSRSGFTGEKYRLENVRTISFDMDSVTDPNSLDYFQLYQDKTVTSLTFLNPATDNIYFYSLPSGTFGKKLPLQEFDIAHSEKIQGYYLLNQDSLLVYAYENAKLYLLHTSKGKLLSQTIGFDSQTGFQNVYPFVSGRSPVYFNQSSGKIYFSGFYSDEGGGYELDKQKNVLAVYQLQNATIDYRIHYPAFYWGHNWGGAGGYRQAYIVPNEKKGIVAASFMASHNLCVYDEATGKMSYPFAGSRYIDKIQSMPYSSNYYDFLNIWDIYNYYLTNPSYSSIHYDRYRDLYYRIAELPLSSKTYYKTKQQKPKTLIILNNQFSIQDEIKLPDGTAADGMLIAQEGIYFKKQDGNENKLSFELTRLVHI